VKPLPRTAAVLAAAGAGTRFRQAAGPPDPGGSAVTPKTFLPLFGRPLWTYAARCLVACDEIESLILVAHPDWTDEAEGTLREMGLRKPGRVVPGGARRQDSVLNALETLADDPPELVAIHDGARPLASLDLVRRCVQSAVERGSGVAAMPVTDTLKRADADGVVEGTVDRSSLWAMQTPQVFRFETLLAAHRRARKDGAEATDDAALIEHIGGRVQLVRGEEANLKVTTPDDLRMVAEIIASRLGGATVRVGYGFDAHRFETGRPCVLGGVLVPHEAGPAGHSDGDVVTHAVMDAVLGALALRDIGYHFPDTDPQYSGISSLELASRVTEMAAEHGYQVVALDATVIAQAPRIAGYVPQMKEALAQVFRCEPGRVSVKGTTTEGMGHTGRGEGIAAHAVAILSPDFPARADASLLCGPDQQHRDAGIP
jgi:2-C-methyl-D-erythritol 4-phosphate cytidylyltransferase/2-C-methyl-D-erythritol 2,4-cyclodiphosphate synthase